MSNVIVPEPKSLSSICFILFQQQVDSVNNEEVEVDIDELLDMDSDEERRRHLQVKLNELNKASEKSQPFTLQELLIDAKKSQNDVKVSKQPLLQKKQKKTKSSNEFCFSEVYQ